MPNVMVTLQNIGGTLCSTPQSLADARYHMPRSNAAKTRKPLKVAGVPQTPETSSAATPLVGRMWRRYCCLTSFFPIVDKCLSCEDIADKVVGWCPDGDFLRHF